MLVTKDLFGEASFDLRELKANANYYNSKSDEITNKYIRTSNRIYKYIDLFCGAGAFHLAFKNHECVLACDIMNHVKIMYDTNYPGTNFIFDVKKIDKSNLPEHDIICGGFPCQAFSIAGNKEGFLDPRGTLFFEIVRLANIRQTKCLIMENVPGLINHDNKRTYQTILRTLDECGYVVYHKVLGGHSHGNVPQERNRLFIVAFNKEKVKNHSQFTFPSPIPLTKTVADCLVPHHEVDDKYWIYPGLPLHEILVKINVEHNKIYRNNFGNWHSLKSGLCRTICARDGAGTVHRKRTLHLIIKVGKGKDIYRALVPREYYNLMGFPADFKLPKIRDYALYQMAGNSIIPPVAKRLVNQVLIVLDNSNY